MKSKRLVKKFFRSAILNGEIILCPYEEKSDIPFLLQYNLVPEGLYLVLYKKNEKNHIRISRFAHLFIDSDEEYYIRLIPVRHKMPTYAILAFLNGPSQFPLDDELRSFSEWVNHVISKLIDVEVYQRRFISSEIWMKQFPLDEDSSKSFLKTIFVK